MAGRSERTGMSEFLIYEQRVGGGTLALSPIPGRTRHYPADWQRLLAWRPDVVVSLTEVAELARKGAGSLGADLAQAGIDWVHFPIADFGVPDVTAPWRAHEDALLARLAQGARVLVHCFGGCGRSGMVVLRLMIAAGEAPGDALARLRALRPCAVETPAQLAWATA